MMLFPTTVSKTGSDIGSGLITTDADTDADDSDEEVSPSNHSMASHKQQSTLKQQIISHKSPLKGFMKSPAIGLTPLWER